MARPTLEKKDKVIRIRISEDMDSRLSKIMARSGMTLSDIVRAAIEDFLMETNK